VPEQEIAQAFAAGNMGAGLAIVCGALGRPFVAVMWRGNSVERARQMTALGAEVILVDQAPGSVLGRDSGLDFEARRPALGGGHRWVTASSRWAIRPGTQSEHQSR
jgi:cysteine synthase